MSYSKTLWVEGKEPGISAERLNKIESGISNSHTLLDGVPSLSDVDNAIALSVISTVNTTTDNINSAINNMQSTIDPQLASINQDISTINSIIPTDEDIVTSVNSAITSGAYGLNTNIENTALSAVDADGRWALSSDVTTLQATSQTESQVQATAVQEIQTAVLDGDIASTQYVQTYVSTAVTEEVLDEAAITALANSAITTAINEGTQIASAQDMTDLQADVGTNTSNITTLNQTLTSNNSAYTQSLSTLSSRIDGNDTSLATLSSDQQTFATDQSALATDISTLSATLGDNYITSTDINATYATNAGVNAMRQVALDNNGNITGWTAVNGDSGSAFLIQADQFAITNQTQSATPFAIDTGTGQAVFNGKVSFTNVTDTGDVATTQYVDDSVPNNIVTTDNIDNHLPGDIVTESGFQASFNQNVTEIDGGKITTGSIHSGDNKFIIDLTNKFISIEV